MAFIENKQDYGTWDPRAAKMTGADLYAHAHISGMESFRDGFIGENVFGSSLRAFAGQVGAWAYGDPETKFAPKPGYDPFKDENVEGLEDQFYVLSRAKSPEHFRYLMDNVVQKNQRRRLSLQYGGAWSTLGALTGTVANPDVLVGWAKLPGLALRSERVAQGMTAVGIGVAEEGVLLATNPDRTPIDSIINIATIGAAGMILGKSRARPGPGTVEGLSRRYADAMMDDDGVMAQQATMTEKMRREAMAAFDNPDARLPKDDMRPKPTAMGEQADDHVLAANFHFWEQTDEARRLRGETEQGGSVGAAQVGQGQPLTAANIKQGAGMKSAWGLEKIPDNPIKRTLMSDSGTAREAVQRLTDMPYILTKNAAGEATYVSAFKRVETQHKPRLINALRETQAKWLEYRTRLGQEVANSAALQTVIDKVTRGRALKGAMTFEEFQAAIGKAKRRMGSAAFDNFPPEVQAAAKMWDETLYKHLGTEAQNVGLFEYHIQRQIDQLKAVIAQTKSPQKIADFNAAIKGLEAGLKRVQAGIVKPDYLNRVYNRNMIKGRRRDFARIIMRTENLTAAEANEVIEKILRSQYVEPMDVNDVAMGSAIKARGLTNTPDIEIEDFLESSIGVLGDHYYRNMAPDVELLREFGDLTFDDLEKVISRELADPKATREVMRDLRAIRDQVRGSYGITFEPDSWSSRTIRILKRVNAMTQLTGAQASLADMGRIVMVFGLQNSFQHGFTAYFKNMAGRKAIIRELQDVGDVTETVMSVRNAMFNDISDAYNSSDRFEKVLGQMNQASFTLNLLNQWTDTAQTIAGMLAANRIADDIARVVRGEGNEKMIERLAQAHIDREMAVRIHSQMEKYGELVDGQMIPNTRRWDDGPAKEIYGAAIHHEVRTTIFQPIPGERPLWMSTEIGGFIAQFKSFGFAATQRILVRGLQRPDAQFANGLLMMVALGAMVDQARREQLGKGPDDRPLKDKILAAVERSGVLGYFMDANNAIQRITNGAVGIGPEGAGYSPVQRASVFMGPSVTTIANLATLASDVSHLHADNTTGKALRRVLPLNNVFWADGIFDQLSE